MLSIDGSHQYDRIRRKHDKAIAIIRFKSLERRYPERPQQRGGRWLWLALGLSLVGSVAFAKWAHADGIVLPYNQAYDEHCLDCTPAVDASGFLKPCVWFKCPDPTPPPFNFKWITSCGEPIIVAWNGHQEPKLDCKIVNALRKKHGH